MVPPSARPTEGRLREALFSIWGAPGGPLGAGARLLDLFAGSGAIGLEAAGRGALAVVAVESDRRALAALEANRAELGEEAAVTILPLVLPASLAPAAARVPGGRFDLVFADPPYRFDRHAELLAAIAPVLDPDGEVALEHGPESPPPDEIPAAGGAPALVRVDRRRYGGSQLSFYRRR